MSVLEEVFTFNEVTVILNKSNSYMNWLVKNGKLKEGVDYRCAGRIKLLTKEALERLKKNSDQI